MCVDNRIVFPFADKFFIQSLRSLVYFGSNFAGYQVESFQDHE